MNLDLRHHAVTARPGEQPEQLIRDLLTQQIPLAVIDLDRSIDHGPPTTLLALATSHPGRLWLGGRITPTSPDIDRLLEAGAAGLILGCNGLFPAGRLDPTALRALSRLSAPDRLMISIDAIDNQVVLDGFTTRTTLSVEAALDAVIQATGGRSTLLYTDAAAALRRTSPPWPRIDTLAETQPGIPIWYAGGLNTWNDLERVWQAGLGAVVGRAYLTEPVGLRE